MASAIRISSITSSRRVPLSIFDRYDAGRPSRAATSACLSFARSRARTSTSPRMRSSAASLVLVETRSAPPWRDVMSWRDDRRPGEARHVADLVGHSDGDEVLARLERQVQTESERRLAEGRLLRRRYLHRL